MLLPNPTYGHQVNSGYSWGVWDAHGRRAARHLCKSVRRLPQHALTTCYCSSCNLQSHLDWLYRSDARAQPSTAKVTGMHRASVATISDSTLLASLLQKLYDCMVQWLE